MTRSASSSVVVDTIAAAGILDEGDRSAQQLVNAIAAARLADVSIKTMCAWIARGRVPGARKVTRPGVGPAEWEIPLGALPRRSALVLRPDRAHPSADDRGDQPDLPDRLVEAFASSSALASDVEELRARLSLVEAELTRLQQLVESQRVSEVYLPPARPERPEPITPAPMRPYVPLGDRAKLPVGWISYNSWLAQHNLNRRAVEQEITKGRMPKVIRGEWWERPQGPTLSAYTSEQHVEAATFARTRWPERFTSCLECADETM